jgi:hypothetical protein
MKIVFKIYAMVMLLMLLAAGKNAIAQVTLNVKLDTNVMWIGDQTKFTMEASYPKDVDVVFPVFSDTIIEKLEILAVGKPDTVIVDDVIKLIHTYTVTSFDSGWYEIPPLDFGIKWPNSEGLDTASSNPVYFGIMTMPLDTANADAITDIKAPLGAPISFKEIAPYLGGLLAYLLVFFLAYVIYKRYFKKEPIFVKKEKPKEPAHLIAFRSLESLKAEKLWQSGNNKAYQSGLTDIVRTYIENRYFIPAMEQTTDEIRKALMELSEVEQGLKSELFEVLSRADFVKFAKATTTPDENEKSIEFVYRFVEKTKFEQREEVNESESAASGETQANLNKEKEK